MSSVNRVVQILMAAGLSLVLAGCGIFGTADEPIATLTAAEFGVVVETDGFTYPTQQAHSVKFVNDQEFDVTVSIWRVADGQTPIDLPPPDSVIFEISLAPGETVDTTVEFPEPGDYAAAGDPRPETRIGGNLIKIHSR